MAARKRSAAADARAEEASAASPASALRSAWGWTAVLVPAAVVFAGGYLLFTAVVGMTSGLPLWASMLISFVVPVAACSGLGSWAHSLGAPRGWLVAAGGGAALMLAPLLLRWALGSWTASFAVPSRRGRSWRMEVDDYAWWSLTVGGLVVVIGLIGYAVGKRRREVTVR